MTEVKVVKQSGSIVEVVAEGHTGYAQEGEDIVCAALSAIMQTAVMGLVKVAKIDCKYVIEDASGRLELVLPDLRSVDRHNADIILDTMLCGIADLEQGYSDYIHLEVK